MGGQDVKEGGVYKRKMDFRENDRDIRIKKRIETRRTLREENEQCNFMYNIGLLG